MMRKWLTRLLPLLLGSGFLVAVVVGAKASGRTGVIVSVPHQVSSAQTSSIRSDDSISLAHPVYLPFVTLQRAPYEVRINCGGPAYTTTQGAVYLADQPYTAARGWGYVNPGEVIVWTNAVAHPLGGSKEKSLYARARAGFEEYRFDLPSGDYLVTFQFAELYRHAPGQRVFDVAVESRPVLTGFDIYAQANLRYAVDLRLTATVTDGQLNVAFSPTVDAPLLNAIVVTDQWEDTLVLPPPGDVRAVGSYNRILVDWADDDSTLLTGYRVYRTAGISGGQELVTSELRLVPYYLDDDVVPGQVYTYTVQVVNLGGQEGEASPVLTATPLPLTSTNLPVYELSVEAADLAFLNADPWTEMYVPATFSFEGQDHAVEVRYRGGLTSREAPKKSWKVRWPDAQLFQGQQRLNLNAEFNDGSLLKEKFCYDMFQDMGVDGPQATLVHLRLNDEYMGLFTQVEQVDEYFLLRTGRPAGSSIYKVEPVGDFSLHEDPADYAEIYQKQTNLGSGYGELIALLELVNNTPDDQFPQALAQVFEIGAYLDYYATVILVANTDVAVKDYYLIRNPETGRWEVLPWDNGSTLWWLTMPIDRGTPENILLTRVLDVPEFRLYYGRRLIEAMDDEFSPARATAIVQSYRDQVGLDGERDIWRRYWWYRGFGPSFTGFVEQRNAYLQSVVYSYTGGLTLPLALELTPAGDQLILYNHGLLDWDVGGMTVRSGQMGPAGWDLPADTVIPAGESLVLWDARADKASLLPVTADALSGASRVELCDKPVHDARLVARWARKRARQNLE
jgi:spore coat protein H